MTFDNAYVYIPLFAIAALSLVLLVLLLIARKRSTARVSFITIASNVIIIVSSIICAIASLTGKMTNGSFMFFCLSIFVIAFILVPYGAMLAMFEPKKIDKLVPKSYNEAALKAREQGQKQKSEDKANELSEEEFSLMDINRDFMAKASQAFGSDKGYNSFLEYINHTIREQINADGAAILMVDDFEDIVSVKAFEGDFPPPYKLPSDLPHKPVRVSTSFKFATFPLQDNIFGEIAKSGRPELIEKPEFDSRIYQNGPEEFLECGSYIIVPMKTQGTVIGVTAFARKNGSEKLTQNDLKTAVTLTDFAAATIQNVISVKDIIEKSELNKEAEIASRIQNKMKPEKLPAVKGLQLGAVWNQADGVCGDYYDIIPSRKDRVSFIMGDIAGKGVNSMSVMTMIRAMLRLVVNTTQSAGKILTWVNKGLTGESFSTDHFGSVSLINYNPINKTMEFSTGGIVPIWYFDSSTSEFTQISQTSDPLGVEKSTEYKEFVQNVKSGDIIVMYTDGVVEAVNSNGQQYTSDTLLGVIKTNHSKPGKEIANLVKADIKNFSGTAEQHDDQSLLIIKIQ
ncbi:MAG: SpoIIE family protein phosphatase [Treponema sp.]|nr:SpoIIE family protein phosphatase [Treponema sp.]MBR4005571.1 SpoIIE family protein phosphatase [Treponema sp.]